MIIVSWTLFYVFFFFPLTVLQNGKIDTKAEVGKVYITIEKQLIWILFFLLRLSISMLNVSKRNYYIQVYYILNKLGDFWIFNVSYIIPTNYVVFVGQNKNQVKDKLM